MQQTLDKKVLTIILAGTLLIVLVSALIFITSLYKKTSVDVFIGNESVRAKVADSETERSKGLSGTKQLQDSDGMLFVFDYSADWQIWMKSMNYPIDIIWLDENKKVIDITTDVSPDTYPQKFTSSKPARYVLELSAGYAKKHGIEVNTLTAFTY